PIPISRNPPSSQNPPLKQRVSVIADPDPLQQTPPFQQRPFRWDELLVDRAVWRAVGGVLATAPVMSFALLWGAKILDRNHGISQLDMRRYMWLPPVLFDLG